MSTTSPPSLYLTHGFNNDMTWSLTRSVGRVISVARAGCSSDQTNSAIPFVKNFAHQTDEPSSMSTLRPRKSFVIYSAELPLSAWERASGSSTAAFPAARSLHRYLEELVGLAPFARRAFVPGHARVARQPVSPDLRVAFYLLVS